MTDHVKEVGKNTPVGVLYLIIFLTALTGFIREAVLAASFGLGQETDAFFFAYGLVQTVHDLIFSGSLSASVIPLLRPMALAADSREARARFTTSLTLLVLGTATLLSFALLLVFPSIVRLLAPDMAGETLGFTLSFGQYLVWALPANALVTLLTLVLNAHGRFRMAAAVYLGSNLLFIGIILALAPVLGDQALPIAGLAGPLFMAPVLARKVWRMGLLSPEAFGFSRPFFRDFLKLSGPSLATLGVGGVVGLLMTSHMILRGFAAAFGAGGISAVGYAFRLYEAPISILVNPAAALIFPAAVAMVAAGQRTEFAALCRHILTWGAILVAPVAIATYAGAELVVTVMLERGSFDASAKLLTTEALQGFAPAIVFESVFVVFFRVFYAMHRPLVPVFVAGATLAALWAFLHGVGAGSLHHVALSLSMAFACAALLLVGELRRRFGAEVWPDFADIGRWALALVLSAAPAYALDVLLGVGLWPRVGSLCLFLLLYPLAVMAIMPLQRAQALSVMEPRLRFLKGFLPWTTR